MRVLVVTNLFPFPSEPTRGIFNYQMLSHLPPDIEPLVLVPVPWRSWQASFAQVQSFQGLRTRYFRFFYPPGLARSLHHVFMWWSLRMSGLTGLDAFAPERVFGSFLYPDGSLALCLSRRYRVPLVLKAHGSDVNLKAADRWIRPHIDASVGHAYSVIAVADSLAGRMRQLQLPAREVRVIENGVDLQRFDLLDKSECRRKLGLTVAGRIVLYVGNLKRDKGCIDLFEAALLVFRQIPDAVLVYVGGGECQQEIQARARELGLQDRVLLVGRKGHAEVPLYLGAADLLALPSHAEGLPNVVLEAFASGRPVVGTEVGAIPALLEGGGGELVPVSDPAALAGAIERVLGSQFDPMVLRARTTSRSWARSAQRTADELRAAGGQSDPAPAAAV